ncbi:MAG: RecQ family ATP-dependent DNA helicase [Treponema sp.]|nr:RecQ family ATP-dependent DNA helicase [Treponema sp.]
MDKLSVTYEKIRDDFISSLALNNFGISYLYPWQRFVVACILDAYEYQTGGLSTAPEGGGDDLSSAGGLEGSGDFAERWGRDSARELCGESEDCGELTDSYCHGRQIVLLPTGAGKSLCFQLPALVFPGPTLVIYPLLALMTDQQRRMEEGSLRSVIFRGGMSAAEIDDNFEKLKAGAKIIIANPEVLKNDGLLERLSGVGISHIAIDEAHCCSEWGDSFRPAYLELGKIIKKINPPVVTAFTATASPQVLSRVGQIIFEGQAHVVRSESDRKNIWYYVRYAAAKKKEALYLAQTELRPMIIFCGTRNKAEDMAHELNVCLGAGSARFYHAGLEREEKEAVEKWFYDSKDGVLTATCAYGMGVDKKDIKTVVHLEASPTAEAYIQEAGRGGRDGSVAKAFLIWSPADSLRYSTYAAGSRQAAMREFAEGGKCRRQVLLDALGAEQAVCSGCDICSGDERAHQIDWQRALWLVRRSPHFYTAATLKEKLFADFNDSYRGILGANVWTHGDCEEVTGQLLESGHLKEGSFLWRKRLSAGKALLQEAPSPEVQTNPSG